MCFFISPKRNTPTVSGPPSFGYTEIHPFVALKNDKGNFASAEATADRGGSDKPLKRLERNFQTASLCAVTPHR